MNIHRGEVCRGALAAVLLLMWGAHGQAQTAATQGSVEPQSKVPARITRAIDDTDRVVLRGNVHPMARAQFDTGVAADSRPMNRMLLLLQRSPEQEKALAQLMEEQQNNASANYHAWLTPEEFGKRFGPADTDIQAVTGWLARQGFQVGKVSKGRTVIEFSGTAGQVRSAFHTEIHQFRVHAETHMGNVSDPQIPAALSPVVRGVVALHNFRPKAFVHKAGTFRRNPQTGEVKPAFTFSDVNGTFYAMGPADFAKIYNIPGTATGAGQSIAVVGQSNINIQDVRDFRTVFGLPANDPTIILNGPDPGLVSGDETESDLDLEWAGAVAPQANIIFVTSQSTMTDFTAGVDASALYIVDNNVAPVLSESYGLCEASLGNTGNQFYNALWQQAAAEGITVVIAAGDNGAAGCDPAAAPANQNAASQGTAVSGFASTPFNVAVGGTDFDDANNQGTYWGANNSSGTQLSALGYIPEITWNDSCARTATSGNVSGLCTTVNSQGQDLLAGSGGPSNCRTSTVSGTTVTCTAGYAKPTYQQGGITPNDNARDIPDISLFSATGLNRSFYIVCQSDQDIPGDTGCNLSKFTTTSPFHDFQAVGGTSAATPAFAAIIALVNQAKGGRQGNANYVLYNLAKNETFANCNSSLFTNPQTPPPSTCVFQDITKGNISVACVGGSPNCSNTSTAANQFGVLTTTKGGATPAFMTGPGYDTATGLGSVNVTNLLNAWASPSLTATTITLNLSNTAPPLGTNVTASGAVTPGTATGVVLLENQSTAAVIPANSGSSNAVPAGGNYTFPTALLPAGSYNVIAHYGGDGTFAASDSAPVAVNVAKQNSQVVVSFVSFTSNGTPVLSTAAQSVAYGSPYILRVDVENAATGTPCENASTGVVSFVCPTGTIQLLNGGQPLNDFPNAQNAGATNVAKLNDRGFAEDQPIQLVPGSYSITATYTPDANSSYNPPTSASNTLSVTITKATTTTAVTASPTTIASGGSVTLTAKVSTNSNGEAPCGSGVTNPGTVQFMNGGSAISGTLTYTGASGAKSSTGLASCTATLSTTLSFLTPTRVPEDAPRGPWIPVLLIATWILALAFLALAQRTAQLQRKWPSLAFPSRATAFAVLTAALLASVAAGIAGCSGSGNGGGGGTNTRSITAVYSGDANYSNSTSPAATVTIQ